MADDPSNPLEGGCLCGRIRYRAATGEREGYWCHCRMCQRAFGNVRVPYLNLRKDQLRWLQGEPAFHASSKIARRGFCRDCGTPLSFEYLDGERMDLSVGSLDEPGAIRPTAHVGIESRVEAWHCDDGLPGQRIDELDSVMKRWRKVYGDDVQPGLEAARGG